jgi:hypothetical protein
MLSLGGGFPLSIRIDSDTQAFASLVSLGGSLQLQGTAAAPITITTWDSAGAGPDANLSEGGHTSVPSPEP